jgi:glycosyltransferase involved in cell wall biosynthesis
MKICLLSYRGNPYCGGQGIYIMYLAEELARQGHEVHVVTGPPYPFEMPGVYIHRLHNNNYFNRGDDFINPEHPFDSLTPLNLYEFIASRVGIFPEMEAFSFRAFLAVRRLHRQYSFDIIHDNQCLGYGFLLMKLLGVPVISTIHHPLTIDRATWFEYPSTFFDKIRRILYYPLIMQRFMANRMDHIITVSRDAAEEIHKAFRVPMKKISVIYNGMDSGLFYPVPGVKKKAKSLIFVGNVADRKKGIIYLLQAMKRTRHNVQLTIVDGGAPNRTFIPEFIDSLGLNSQVRFTGKIPIEQLVQLYAETEIAVAPSLYEGFGFPAAEAMACQVPVIATTGGALPEVVGEHEKTGLLVAPRDPDALARSIDFLLDNDQLRKSMARSARQRVLSLFTWRKAAGYLVEEYKKIINAYN